MQSSFRQAWISTSTALFLVMVSFGAPVVSAADAQSTSSQEEAASVSKGGDHQGMKISSALYQTCAACHGADATGNSALNAPSIAGLDEWYLQRQMQNFKFGVRGSHPQDTYGQQMRPMVASLSDEDIDSLAAIIAGQSPVPLKTSIEGDPAAGKQHYIVCGSCHGARGEGNQALNSPSLAGLDDWYILRQLQNFRSGIRGARDDDKFGRQMAKMAQVLADDAALRDVTAYIQTLQRSGD